MFGWNNMILKICAKCSDLCSSVLTQDNGIVVKETSGYVPSIMPGGDSDYVTIEIDVSTGRILNWKAPTTMQLKNFIEGDLE